MQLQHCTATVIALFYKNCAETDKSNEGVCIRERHPAQQLLLDLPAAIVPRLANTPPLLCASDTTNGAEFPIV